MRKLTYVVIAFALCAISITTYRAFTLFTSDEEGKREAIRFYHQVRLGEDEQKVIFDFNKGQFHNLTLVKLSNDSLVAKTPWKFGSINWDVYIDMTKKKVSSVKIRSSDSYTKLPHGAPPDKVS